MVTEPFYKKSFFVKITIGQYPWLLLCVTLPFLCGGCGGLHSGSAAGGKAVNVLAGVDKEVDAGHITSEPRKLVAQGLQMLSESELTEASELFNQALKVDPANSYINLLNGLTYHLRALAGDSSFFALAQQGYELAVKFDKSNWLAMYQLGLLALDQQKFGEARRLIAEALIYNDDDADMLYSMVVASYYARDPRSAAAAFTRLHQLEPQSQRVLKAGPIIMAAMDKPQEARKLLDLYQDGAQATNQHDRVASRLADWQHFYARHGQQITAPPKEAAGTLARRPQEIPQDSAPGDSSLKSNEKWFEEEEEVEEEVDQHQMVIVDVVIIRTEENLTTRKGVNLLNGLQLQFGSSSDPAFSRGIEDIFTINEDGFGGLVSQDRTQTRTITRMISIPALTYSLNIFNTNTSRNEILARPTIVGLNGEESEFFTGTKLKAAAVATSAAGGESVEVEEEIGVKLAITPEFLEDGRVKLRVLAERTFLQTPSSDVTFQFKVEMSQTKVSANVVMDFGETLILSGLSEKETERKRDGVPFLQEIPGLQYMFSRKDTKDFQKSVLILVTPRANPYIYRNGRRGKMTSEQYGNRPSELTEPAGPVQRLV